MLRPTLLLVAASALGCGPPKAPEEINALSRFLYREWANPDPKVMEDGVAKLELLLAKLGLSPEGGARSYELTPLTVDDLKTIERPPNADPGKCMASAVARESAWGVRDHARLQVSPEQLEIEPSATAYTRKFTEPADPACFVDRKCPQIATENNLSRKNALLEITYILYKRFRWVKLGPTGDRWAMVSRSYSNRAWPDEKSSTALMQSYTLELWIPRDNGVTWRYQAPYSEQRLNVEADRGLQLAVVTSAIDGAFRAADEVIGKRYYPNR